MMVQAKIDTETQVRWHRHRGPRHARHARVGRWQGSDALAAWLGVCGGQAFAL